MKCIRYILSRNLIRKEFTKNEIESIFIKFFNANIFQLNGKSFECINLSIAANLSSKKTIWNRIEIVYLPNVQHFFYIDPVTDFRISFHHFTNFIQLKYIFK